MFSTTSYNNSPEQIESLCIPSSERVLRNEEGGVRVWFGALALSAVLSVGAIVGGTIVGNFLSLRPKQTVDEEKSVINATHILTDSIEMPCKANSFYAAEGSVVNLPMTIKDKEIPEFYTRFTFEKGSTPALTTCEDESKDSAITSKEDGVITTKSGEAMHLRIVDINTDNIVTTIKFPEGNKFITRRDGALMSALIARSQDGKLAITAACLPFKLGAKVAGKSLDCGAIASVATRYVNKIETNGQITAEDVVLRNIQQRGSEESWQQQTLPAFMDSLACKAINDGGDEALQALRIRMTGTNPAPDFSKDMFDKYRGNVLLEKDSDVKILPKVKITASKPYVPKCFSNSTTDINTGLITLLGK